VDLDNSVDEAEAAKKKKQQNSRKKRKAVGRVLPYDVVQRRLIIVKLATFFLISLVYFYLIFYTGFETVG
jgi:hypothetical protein